MKYTFRSVLLGMCLLLLVFPVAAQETEDLQPGLAMNVLGLPLPIYLEADRQSDRLAEIRPGELVNVLEVAERWAQVEYSGIVGWAGCLPRCSSILINVSSPIPMPRGYHQMVYDVESDRVILFGGESSPASLFNDTWAYEVSANAWTKMAPDQSPPLGEGPLAYDSQSDRMIFLYGYGSGEEYGSSANTATQTWAYDYNTDTWTNMEPETGPPPVVGARMAYDSESDRMILFGGLDPKGVGGESLVFLNETWAYDYDTNVWTKMTPSVSPPGMNYHNMAYDPDADRIVLIPMLWGRLPEETWVYDYNTDTWEAREMTDGPGGRDYSGMVYAAGIGKMILYGAGDTSLKNDTWTYDFSTNTWAELHPDTAPGRRGWHAMAYSRADDLVVLFGGGTSHMEFTMETWIYDPKANTWTQVGP